MNIVQLSENTLLILFDPIISRENLLTVNQWTDLIKRHLDDVIIDMVPAYASIHLSFNLLKISGLQLKADIEQLADDVTPLVADPDAQGVIEIPVYYGCEVALDMDIVMCHAQLSADEIIQLHSDKLYDVYAIGFAPGFAYLGNVDKRIAFPRKQNPRQRVPKGSLGIADQQTAIYPSDSPGGWQIIGRTPLSLVDFNTQNLTLFSVGDKVKFVPIDRQQYLALGGAL